MKTAALTVCAAFALAGTASAANDWSVISTAGDPDPVTSFDLANPSGTATGIGFVDGNFNRGKDGSARTPSTTSSAPTC